MYRDQITWSMFADACQKAIRYTRPVAISTRRYDGTLRTDVGTMIVVNEDGWILTAAHLFDSFFRFQSDTKKIAEINGINASKVQKSNAPPNEIKIDKTFIVNHSFWWGWDNVRVTNVMLNRQVDVALAKLEPFNPEWVGEYPVFADPDHMPIGRSVCRAGYPFLNITPEFIEGPSAFKIPKIPAERFFYPLPGILSHMESKGKTMDESCTMKFIETSSPGLKGQSGGPIFDVDGHVYGMQIVTEHRPTGFHPTAEFDGQKYIENQFLNIGVGVHVSTLYELMDKKGIRYSKEGDESGYRIVN